MIPPFAYGGISVPISFFRLTTGPSRWTSDILGFQEELVRGGYDQVALCYRQFIASLIVKPPVLLTHLNVKYPTTIGSAMRPIDLTDPIQVALAAIGCSVMVKSELLYTSVFLHSSPCYEFSYMTPARIDDMMACARFYRDNFAEPGWRIPYRYVRFLGAGEL